MEFPIGLVIAIVSAWLSPSSSLLNQAMEAERQGQWATALDLYLKLRSHNRTAVPDLAERIQRTVRSAAAEQRHRDPAFQRFTRELPLADALHLYADVLTNLNRYYVSRERASPAERYRAGLDELERALQNPAFTAQALPGVTAGQLKQIRNQLLPQARTVLVQQVGDARQAVRDLVCSIRTVAGSVQSSAIILEFVCGACHGLDDYTQYTPPAQRIISHLSDYGLRLDSGLRDGTIRELTPLSWAALASELRPGDRIVRIDGRDLRAASGEPVLESSSMQAGHVLDVIRPGMTMPTTVFLPTPRPTVYGTAMAADRDGVGYLRIASFGDVTVREFDAAVATLRMQGLRSLVVDLRSNPGGSFPAGVDLARRVIPEGPVALTAGRDPAVANRTFHSESGAAALDIPLVLLVDAMTMSSAEVVAAAVRDHRRGTIVGMPTFGKGAIQSRFPAPTPEPRSAGASGVLILTVGTAYSPRGTPLQGSGIVPDITEPDPMRQLKIAVHRAGELALPMMP